MRFINKLVGLAILFQISYFTIETVALKNGTTCVESRLLDVLEKWRNGSTLPFPLPTLDVVQLWPFEGQFSGYGIKMSYDTGDMWLEGVNNFAVEDITAFVDGAIKTSGTVKFPLLTIKSDNYNLKGRAYFIYNLKGSGKMDVDFHDVYLTFMINLLPATHESVMEIKVNQLNFNVTNVKINLADSSYPINNVLNTQAKNIVDSYHSLLVETATQGLTHTLNRFLDKNTSLTFLETILGDCVTKSIKNNKL